MLLGSDSDEHEEDEEDAQHIHDEGEDSEGEQGDVDAQVKSLMGQLSGDEDALDSSDDLSDLSDDEGQHHGQRNGQHFGHQFGQRKRNNGLLHSDDEEEDAGTPEEQALAARIRMYERSKLRWYYAIVECDSPATALRLYEECDGLEFQRSACKFDLRFVPEEQSFEGRQVRDAATTVPHDYEPPVFHTRALQHTDVKLTWDEDDIQRKRVLGRRPAANELKDDDFKAYLASESESEGEEDQAQLQAKYRKLLQQMASGGNDERRGGGKGWGAADVDEDNEEKPPTEALENKSMEMQDKSMEMEVTFAPGLDALGKKILEKKKNARGQEGETVWEAYMRRKREKRRIAKELGKARPDSDTSDDDGGFDEDDEDGEGGFNGQHGVGKKKKKKTDDPFDDPFFNDDAQGVVVNSDDEEPTHQQPKSNKKKKEKRENRGVGGDDEGDGRSKGDAAALELLLMDDAALTHMAKTGNTTLAAMQTNGSTHAASQDTNNKDTNNKDINYKDTNTTGKTSRGAKARAKKQAKKREREQGSDDEDLAGGGGDFAVNLDDTRFAALTSPEFALDPTDPRYKQATTVVEGLKKRRSKKTKGAPRAAEEPAAAKVKNARGEHGGKGSSAAAGELQMMVAKLKHKQGKKK